jgi:hypothetical protein
MNAGTPQTLPPIAEGRTLAALMAVNKAYSATDSAAMLGRTLRTARWPSKLAFILAILGSVAIIKWRSEIGAQVAGGLLAVTILWLKHDAFRMYHARKHTASFLQAFAPRDQAIRYIVFCEELPRDIAQDATLLERILRLLEQRQKVRHAGLVSRHPFVTFLVAIFVMLVGVLISKAADASISAIIAATVVIFFLIIIAAQLSLFWRTRDYRDEERTEFVLWLWAEACENPHPSL